MDQVDIRSGHIDPPETEGARPERYPVLDGYYHHRSAFIKRKQTLCFHTWNNIRDGQLRAHLRITRGRGKWAGKVQNFCLAASHCAQRAKNLSEQVAHLPADWQRYEALGMHAVVSGAYPTLARDGTLRTSRASPLQLLSGNPPTPTS